MFHVLKQKGCIFGADNYFTGMKGNWIGAKKDEATEIAPNLMFSQRNNPYCELLHILCCKNRYFSNTARVFFEKISNFDKNLN
jgi:hypothetical protein